MKASSSAGRASVAASRQKARRMDPRSQSSRRETESAGFMRAGTLPRRTVRMQSPNAIDPDAIEERKRTGRSDRDDPVEKNVGRAHSLLSGLLRAVEILLSRSC